MKKHLIIILSFTFALFPFVDANENGSIEHTEDNITLTYNGKSITLKDNNINFKTQKCPLGYHVGTAEDWSNLIKLRWDIEGNNYKFTELNKSNNLYKINESFKDGERTDEELGIIKFGKNILINKGININTHQSCIRTSSYGANHKPYIFVIEELADVIYDPIYSSKKRVSSIGLKTCNHLEVKFVPYGNLCDKDVVTRCFKDDENAVINNQFSKEYNDAYIFAYNNKITTMPTIEQANMNGEIIRAEIAKMFANWVKAIGYYADTNIPCNFTDTSSVKGDLATAIIESCQYGIMGQGITQFRPHDKITKAEVATAISRILRGTQYDGGTPFYTNHVYALENAGVLSNSSNINSNELRGNVMAMLMRANDILKNNSTDCDSPEIALTCATDTEKCPDKCKEF